MNERKERYVSLELLAAGRSCVKYFQVDLNQREGKNRVIYYDRINISLP